MKLAEVLAKRSEIKKEVTNYRGYGRNLTLTYTAYAKDSVPVVEGADSTAQAELQRFIDLHDNLRDVVSAITRANQDNKTKDGLTLADALIARDHAKRMSEAYKTLATQIPAPQKVVSRGTGVTLDTLRAQKEGIDLTALKDEQEATRTVTLSVLSRAEATKRADQFASEYRRLDTALQEANWTVEVDLTLKDTGTSTGESDY